MLCFTGSLFHSIRIRIQINAIWDSQPFTFRNIMFPLLIILGNHILSISASYDCKFNAVCLYFIPVYCSIMFADINALFLSSGDRLASVIDILSINFFPCIGISSGSGSPVIFYRLSVFISPAVFFELCFF